MRHRRKKNNTSGNTLLNNEQIITEIREIKTVLETKNNKNLMIKNLEDETKAVLRGKIIEI